MELSEECEQHRCSYDPMVNTPTWIRSVKRKLDELEIQDYEKSFMIPGVTIPEVARVEIENECGALREMVTNQQQTINALLVELEEERNASSSAANEAMSMILRLQREKAEIEMELRQFKRFSEQKTGHDQQEIAALEDLLYKREQTIQSLTCEVQAYKYRMMSYGLTESEADGEKGVISSHTNSIITNSESNQFDFIPYDYPPLKCHTNDQEANYTHEFDDETIDIDKYAFTETPCSLKDIEQRINQLEKTQSPASSHNHQPVFEKIIVGQSPIKRKPASLFSYDSGGSLFATIKEDNPGYRKVDNGSEFGSEMSDRIYTVDSVHYGDQKTYDPKENTYDDEIMSSPKDSMCHSEIQDPGVMKLYARLHALEADRESMRQAIINMRTDKAQLVLLKEIAQNLCKDMSPANRMRPIKKQQQSVFESFAKSFASLILWKRKTSQCKYMFGMTENNPGLMVLFDKGTQVEQWRCVSRTQL